MTTYTNVSKNPLSWEAPDVAVDETYYLNIGTGYNLLIGSGYKLIIQPGRSGTTWTTTSRNPLTF